jgi:hypothetical protein
VFNFFKKISHKRRWILAAQALEQVSWRAQNDGSWVADACSCHVHHYDKHGFLMFFLWNEWNSTLIGPWLGTKCFHLIIDELDVDVDLFRATAIDKYIPLYCYMWYLVALRDILDCNANSILWFCYRQYYQRTWAILSLVITKVYILWNKLLYASTSNSSITTSNISFWPNVICFIANQPLFSLF